MGLGVLKTRAFLRALLSGKGRVWVRMLGEQGGKGQDLWHFPSSWKQRQIPASCVSNPVPPSRVAGAEGNTAGLRPHPVTWLPFQTISFLAWAITYFQISEMLSAP